MSKEKVDGKKTEDIVIGNGKEVLGIDDDELAEPEVPVEDHGGDLPKAMKAPSPPSRQEALEHRILHCPIRAWCPECVAGKSKCNPHLTSNRDTEQSVPVVAFDYAFMGDDSVAPENEEEKRSKVKILVGRDKKSKVYSSIAVPQKGVDPEEWVTRRGLKFLEFLGYDKVILRTDQEVALGKVMRSLKLHRGEGTQVMTEESPVGDSKSNGFIEHAIQRVEGQVRTFKLALENRLGTTIPEDSCIMPWLVEYAGVSLTLGEVSSDGKTPYQRLRGKKLQHELVEFGERVMFMPLDALKHGKLQPRWLNGVYLGIRLETSERLVGTSEGVFECRSIRRILEVERWSKEDILGIKGVPWKPYQFTDNDRILTKLPEIIDPRDVDIPIRANEGPIAPRRFRIDKKDVIDFGFTPQCPGCYAAHHNLKSRAHTQMCRDRFEKAFEADATRSGRVKEQRLREDVWLEQQLKERDEKVADGQGNAGQGNVEVKQEEEVVVQDQPVPNTFDADMEDRFASMNRALVEQDFHVIVNNDMESDLD